MIRRQSRRIRQRTARAAFFLARLATVEVQLIMQYCDQKSLLALARCCLFTHAAASDRFAWRSLSPLRLESTVPNLASHLSSSLLRHADVALKWAPALSEQGMRFTHQSAVSEEEIANLCAVPSLREFDARARHVTEREHWEALLSHASFSGLTSLVFTHFTTSALVPSIVAAHLPRLSSLHVGARGSFPRGYFDALPRLTSLTDVRVLDSPFVPSQLDCEIARVGECVRLQSLHLTRVHDGAWARIAAGSGLQRLHSLTIENAHALHGAGREEAASPIVWAAFLAHLPSLRHLNLHRCAGIDAMLRGLVGEAAAEEPVCPSLASLSLVAKVLLDPTTATPREIEWGAQIPCAVLLLQLLSARPSLHATVQLPSLEAAKGEPTTEEVMLSLWTAMKASFDPLLQLHPSRTKLVWLEWWEQC